MATPDIYGQLPPELLGDQRALERQNRIAEALMQNGAAPMSGRMVGRFYVPPSPVEGIANLANSYAGMKMGKDVDQGYAALGKRYGDMQAEEIAKVADLRRNGTAVPQTMGADDQAMIADQGGQADPTKQVPATRQDIAALLANSRLPKLLEMGLAMSLEKPAFSHVAAGGSVIDENGKIVATAPDHTRREPGFKIGDIRKLKEGRNEITQEYQADGTWKKIATGDLDKGANVNVQAPVTPVTIADPKDPTGRDTIVVDGRTGNVIGKGPKMTEAGKMDAKQIKAMSGLSEDLQKAEDLLMGVKRTSDGQVVPGNKPTGSGIGSLYDSAAAFVGATPAGAAEADELKVVSGRLVGKVPRFEGPQSDKDTALYKEMAGNAGNDKIPQDRRLAAIRKMRELYAGYETGEKGRIAGNNAAPGAPKPAAGASGSWSPQDKAALDWAAANPNDPRAAAIKQRLGQ